jgi:uncharacterized membrane protein YjjP (DUF1212 family)
VSDLPEGARESQQRPRVDVELTGALTGALMVAVAGSLVARLLSAPPWAGWLVAFVAGTVGVLLLARAELSAVDRRLSVRLLFEKRDAWFGVYWTRVRADDLNDGRSWHVLHVYVCVVPFVPLLLTYSRKVADA